MKVENSEIVWYVIRITYSRELKFKEYLDERNIENFVPMQYEMIVKGNKKTRKLVPVVHNLIFVHTTRKKIDEIKRNEEYRFPIRYIIDCVSHAPVIVPEKQMHDFIMVSSSFNDQLIYLNPVELNIKKGDRVRITNGIWAGIEGDFVRIRGDRRLVVSIQGIMAVATAFVHPSCIEKINC
jgi:transcription antitermination factor NusG